MKKIKVMHLITSLEIGGAQKVVWDLSKNLNQAKFDQVVVSLMDITNYVPLFEKENIPVEVFDLRKNPFSFFKILSGMSRLIQKEKIDIIHAQLYHSALITTFLKFKFPHLKFVFTSQNWNIESKAREFFIRNTKGFRDTDIIFSEQMRSPIYKDDAIIIPNFITVDAYDLNVPKFSKFTFLNLGRLGEQKNQKAFIEPVKRLKQKGYSFQVLIAGVGSLEEELKQQIADNDLQEEIKLIGHCSDVPKICNQAHCFAMPSLWEGLPLAMLEAGASELPIISTVVGSIDMVLNENTGYPLSTLDQLEASMERVMNNYEEATQKAAAMKQLLLEQFDVKANVRKHEELYVDLMNTVKGKQLVKEMSA